MELLKSVPERVPLRFALVQGRCKPWQTKRETINASVGALLLQLANRWRAGIEDDLWSMYNKLVGLRPPIGEVYYFINHVRGLHEICHIITEKSLRNKSWHCGKNISSKSVMFFLWFVLSEDIWSDVNSISDALCGHKAV